MMLSVLVWLAMQGQVQTKPYCEVDDNGMYCYNQPSSIWHAQAQTPDLSQLTDPGIVQPLTCNYCGQYVAPVPKCSDSVTKDCDCGKPGCAVETPKPVEFPCTGIKYEDRGGSIPVRVPQPDGCTMPGYAATTVWKDAPAEHVIEIKTVREDQAATCKIDHLHDEYPGYNLRDMKSCVCSEESYASGYRISYQYGDYTSGIGYSTPDLADPIKCVRVTRELWIDGVRWGVVKGLE